MSEENVEVVKAVYEAANRRDADAVLALYDPGVELDPRGGPMGRLIGPGIYRGHEGVRRFFRAYHEAWGQIDYEVEELIDGGERVFGVHNIKSIVLLQCLSTPTSRSSTEDCRSMGDLCSSPRSHASR